MTQVAEDVKVRIAELSATDRAELATFLLDTLDESDDSEYDRDLKADLERRIQEIEDGTAIGVDAEVVFAEIERELARSRSSSTGTGEANLP